MLPRRLSRSLLALMKLRLALVGLQDVWLRGGHGLGSALEGVMLHGHCCAARRGSCPLDQARVAEERVDFVARAAAAIREGPLAHVLQTLTAHTRRP